ncbi:tetratricopeptide repeat protein [Planktothrix sp. FACHB-1355]|uniref:Tetratricopeptide repeat protein n=1 Tax=Aerosakkonema funiforme FACHB-1375 TaxID=2949571 RepID=A0A926VHL1_9CYAN|nr:MULTISPECIES: tetratricopeptide repeat protein [Oscillatoriales]MBD2183273.1 tetratricopeptide repeat protein [Aerosakkonema funiforme FACHB-1375]MBD3559312.1 tetratricopeptide repeat protein [Planktothrix sp. FACHB-1355]
MANFTPQVKRLGKNEREQVKVGFALAKEKRFDEALSEFEAILKDNPASKPAHLGAGNMLLRQERYEEALEHFKAVKKLDPLMVQAPLAAGRVYLRQDNLAQALEEFKTALSIDPNSTQAYQSIGRILVKQEKYAQAEEQFRQALRLDPRLVPVRLQLAQIYQTQGKLPDAVSEIKTAINVDSKAWRAYQALGRIYTEQKNYKGAKEAFEKAVSLNPEMPPAARLGLIEALVQNNELEEAIEMLNQVPRVKQLAAKTHQLWGDIYQRQGLTKEAAEEYRAASLAASEAGDIPDELAELDAILEQDDTSSPNLISSYRSLALQQLTQAQTRARQNFQQRRQGKSTLK